ncbi:MAG: hypothetical protein AUJ85_08875 [Elusimicrobia bacterium CG1_02_37_114]|nr:MAG: hypothetical protein AUJ85_08875 [Elusimicrobia bacterium CG1_02_37_114]PIV53028.1 MAG: two-component system response regulator [Elusimicrobia bacterium CG02_land_8_20_14_3_00_37_13]PIZ13968.1 MAG: two-component system response regulator [Elusimicrobia bacterium CG_4_10_14_0_8_um_filter_37_32]
MTEIQTTKMSVLVVDDDESIGELCYRALTNHDLDVTVAEDGEEALRKIQKKTFDIVLTDLSLPIMSGIELLKEIGKSYPSIDVIIMTGHPKLEIAVECMKKGAYDYIVKPFDVDYLLVTVNKCLAKRLIQQKLNDVQKIRIELEYAKRDMEKTYLDTLKALANVIELRDMYTETHSETVSKNARLIAINMKLKRDEIKDVELSALLHDIGKIAIPDKILLKPGKLTPEEFEIMKKHSELGMNIIKHIGFLKDALLSILHHHEQFDGKGYPQKLAGDNIPLGARIVNVADSYHAMISERPYRGALSKEEALKELERCSGTQFDPEIVQVFLNIVKKKN